MKSKLWVIALVVSLAIVLACARKEEAPAAGGGEPAVAPAATESATPVGGVEKTYSLRGTIVSRDMERSQITVDHEKIEGLWEPMTMAFEVNAEDFASLPPDGSRIRAMLHVQDGRYRLTDIRTE